ncbi:hypothetical protein [uncultured Sphaerochaeta sp.]|uniref:hypothetical protein n=1 Tax=uncultured Sphaerochaeta sp. TaxID=886478 RepID=UPI002A0A1042|nr:hypothetical protein [uncultured Sphaerochaeta sp.]
MHQNWQLDGDLPIGVRTIQMKVKDQVNVIAATDKDPYPMYDRPLTLEIWYPASLEAGTEQLCSYTDYMGRKDLGNLVPFDYLGRAVRDSKPDVSLWSVSCRGRVPWLSRFTYVDELPW